MAYPHKWSPISYKSSAGQRKHIGQTPMLYRWTTPPTTRCQLQSVPVCLHRKEYRSVTALLEAVRCFCRCRLVCCVQHSEPLDRPYCSSTCTLAEIGATGPALSWLRSYLSGRQARQPSVTSHLPQRWHSSRIRNETLLVSEARRYTVSSVRRRRASPSCYAR